MAPVNPDAVETALLIHVSYRLSAKKISIFLDYLISENTIGTYSRQLNKIIADPALLLTIDDQPLREIFSRVLEYQQCGPITWIPIVAPKVQDAPPVPQVEDVPPVPQVEDVPPVAVPQVEDAPPMPAVVPPPVKRGIWRSLIIFSYLFVAFAYHQAAIRYGREDLDVLGLTFRKEFHHECPSLMKIRPSLYLKVRSVGMLPVKEKTGDPLTWKLVEEQPSPELLHVDGEYDRGSETSSADALIETKVTIDLTGQSGLSCCICKGPPERPGIFVHSTKCNGVAREAGLRPGDQVLSCNGHPFLHIQFAEAVYYLKSSKVLKLRVLKGAASDLFPGESSGYNSSLNGDACCNNGNSVGENNPNPSFNGENHVQNEKRLSMVTEEGHHHEHGGQYHHNDYSSSMRSRSNNAISMRQIGNGGSVALDRSMEWDEVEQVWRKAEKETLVIEVKGEDSNLQRLRSEEERIVEDRRKLEETQRLLREEAQRLEEEKLKFANEKRRFAEVARTMSPTASMISSQGDNGSNYDGGVGSSSSSGGNSLAGALNQEILKKNEHRESNGLMDKNPKRGTVEQKRSLFNTHIDQEKRQQHDQLIEVFKGAHREMFAHSVAQDTAKEKSHNDTTSSSNVEERSVIKSRRVQKEMEFVKCLHVDFGLDRPKKKLKECEVSSNILFYKSSHNELIDHARLLIFEAFCKIHQCISTGMLAEKLDMSTGEAERWIVNLIQKYPKFQFKVVG